MLPVYIVRYICNHRICSKKLFILHVSHFLFFLYIPSKKMQIFNLAFDIDMNNIFQIKNYIVVKITKGTCLWLSSAEAHIIWVPWSVWVGVQWTITSQTFDLPRPSSDNAVLCIPNGPLISMDFTLKHW